MSEFCFHSAVPDYGCLRHGNGFTNGTAPMRAAATLLAVALLSFPALAQDTEAGIAQAGKSLSTLLPVAIPKVTSRAPGFKDDGEHGYPVGSTWLYGGTIYVSKIATEGGAQWLAMPAPALPLDEIGLHINTLAVSSAGSGYAVNEVITVTGGATATVVTITGGGSTGPIGTVTLAVLAYHGCAITNPGGLTQQSSSASGTGATFSATFLSPYAYGSRLLTRCYTANKALDLQFGSTVATVGFSRSGLIDYTAVDRLFEGVRPGVVVVYDQGVNGVNGTEGVAKAGTISALRAPHGIRSLVMDGDVNGPLDSGALNAVTAVDMPAALSVNNQANTLIWAGGVQSADHPTGIINVGGQSGPSSNLGQKVKSSAPNLYAAAGGSSAVLCPGMPYDRDNIAFVVDTSSGTQCILNGIASAVGGGTPLPGTVSTASLGYGYGGVGFAYVDYDLAVIVPWVMSAKEVAAASSAIATAFAIPPQVRSIIIVDGDSDTDGHGSPAQHEWPRMLMEQLGRPDIQMLDTAFYGSTLGGAAANGAPGSRIGEEPLNVLPALDQAYAAGAPNRWVVMGPMGYNDLNRGDSVASVEAAYTSYCDAVHQHHGLCALLVVPSRADQTGGIFPNLATINAWIMASEATTNAHADLPILSLGCPPSLICQQSDGIHETQINGWGQAQAVAAALAPLLQ